MKPVVLNLGCGTNILPSSNKYTLYNIDLDQPCDLQADIFHLPFKTGAVTTILIAHVLEHIQDIQSVKQEMARVLKPKIGVVQVDVPHYLSPDAYGDPTHIRQFSHHSFYTQYWPGFNCLNLVKQKQDIPENFIPIPGMTVAEDDLTSVWRATMVRTEHTYEEVKRAYKVKFIKAGCGRDEESNANTMFNLYV